MKPLPNHGKLLKEGCVSMANIYDIAKKSGVSRSTVSRVINNQPSVSEDKRLRVLEAIDQLKYTPSATARALARNKTNTIGVTSRELAHSFYNEFIKSIHFGADQRSYGVLYTMRNAYLKTNIDFKGLMHKKVDGYMFVGEGTVTEDELSDLIHNDIPVVCYEFDYKIDDALFININNKESGYLATEYLYALGHRNIIHLSYASGLQEMSLRAEGFNKAVMDLGIGSGEIFKVAFTLEEMYDQVQSMMPYIKKSEVTAAFCGNNTIASVLIEVLIANGYEVPKDFSVIGFDDTPVERGLHMSRQIIPEITSIKQPQKAMAEYGLNALMTSIETGKALESGNKIFKCALVLRDTTSLKL